LVIAFPAGNTAWRKFIRPASTSFGAKLKPYECGIPAESDARGRYSVPVLHRGHAVCDFRRGTMFLIPGRILYKGWVAAHHGLFALVSMMAFLGILLVGIYGYTKRVLLSGREPYSFLCSNPTIPFASCSD